MYIHGTSETTRFMFGFFIFLDYFSKFSIAITVRYWGLFFVLRSFHFPSLSSVYSLNNSFKMKTTQEMASFQSHKGEGDRTLTDAQIRTLIAHAKSPGTVLWTLDVPLTLGRPQTKEEKSTNQWALGFARGGKGGGGGVVIAGPGQVCVSLNRMHED